MENQLEKLKETVLWIKYRSKYQEPDKQDTQICRPLKINDLMSDNYRMVICPINTQNGFG